jgi:hypothetical protein
MNGFELRGIDAPVSFTAIGTDSCSAVITPVVTAFDCFKFTNKGKRIDKTGSCMVSFQNDTISIVESGGVDTQIQWAVSATDNTGNMTAVDCKLTVVNPGKKSGK